jgi:hypothetical protein
MPWQPVPSLLIIMGMFNVTAGLMWSIDRLYYGPKVSCECRSLISLPQRSSCGLYVIRVLTSLLCSCSFFTIGSTNRTRPVPVCSG